MNYIDGLVAAGWAKVMADPRMKPDVNPMPFDGKRLIYGGFEVLVERLSGASGARRCGNDGRLIERRRGVKAARARPRRARPTNRHGGS